MGTYCGLIMLVATVGKLGGSTLASWLTGMPMRGAAGLGTLMNTRPDGVGILAIGLDIKVISPALLSMMVVMALSSAARTLASPSANRRWPNEIGRRGFDRLVPVRHRFIRTKQNEWPTRQR
jgi:Kef-type K+ transport system membrane component KefB